MKSVLDLLSLLGDLEWARCVGGETGLAARPPLIAWRFKSRDEQLDARIVAAVSTYAGATPWSLKKGERNWVLEPQVFATFAKNYRVDADALRACGEMHPQETRVALDDVPGLVAHMREALLFRTS